MKTARTMDCLQSLPDKARFGFITRSACPACESSDFAPFYKLPAESAALSTYLQKFYKDQGCIDLALLKGWEYVLAECRSCSLVFQQTILNDHGMHVLYEMWLDPAITFEESRKHSTDYYLNHVEEIRQVIAHFGRKPHELDVMDFGMGWAEWCKVASALGCRVTGAELSEARIQNARVNNIPVVNLDNIRREEFDFINTEQVFEHIPKPLETLKQLVAITRPGGIIKISVPDCDRVHEVLAINDWTAPKGTANSLNMVAPLEHINGFRFKSLERMASLAGLGLVSELTYREYPDTLADMAKNDARHIYVRKFRRNRGTYLFFQKPLRSLDRN
jgi:2-polyprenyl-3-methyl-5-hydroxy-6-metoxy-1,4-benzoquinol methylase